MGPETLCHAGAVPRPYLIVTTGRTGSALLAHALAGTGRHGTPDEQLTGPDIDRWSDQLRVRSPLKGGSMLAYLDALRAQTSTPNGGFGTKLHSWAIPIVLRALATEPDAPSSDPGALLAWAFPGSVVLWSRRRDRVAGAVSLWRARQTGAWAQPAGSVLEESTDEPTIAEISELHRSLHLADLSVPGVLGRADFPVHEVVYEDLIVDWSSVLVDAFAFVDDDDDDEVGGGPDGGPVVAPPTLAKQSGVRTGETIARWVRATGGCPACGHPATTS